MPDWTATGAGTADFNTDYTEAGTYNEKPYYTSTVAEITVVLWWDNSVPDYESWALSYNTPGDIIYYIGTFQAELPANDWTALEGAAPPPVLAAYSAGGGPPGRRRRPPKKDKNTKGSYRREAYFSEKCSWI